MNGKYLTEKEARGRYETLIEIRPEKVEGEFYIHEFDTKKGNRRAIVSNNFGILAEMPDRMTRREINDYRRTEFYTLGTVIDKVEFYFVGDDDTILIRMLSIPLTFVSCIEALISDISKARNRSMGRAA